MRALLLCLLLTACYPLGGSYMFRDDLKPVFRPYGEHYDNALGTCVWDADRDKRLQGWCEDELIDLQERALHEYDTLHRVRDLCR